MRRLFIPITVAVLTAACGSSATPVTEALADTPAATTAAVCSDGDYGSRTVLHESAKAGEIASDVPPHLGAAIEAVPEALFTAVLYAGCFLAGEGGLAFEQMAWTNGIGLLIVAWQEWPGDGDLVELPLGGTARRAGVVQVSTIDTAGPERTRVVHLFDGARVVTVATFSLTTLSTDQVEELGWAVYDAMPLPPGSRAGAGASRKLDDLLSALPTDEFTVGDPEGRVEMSPFTAAVGTAHATYEFTAGGADVIVFDFGAVEAARRAAAEVSSDGYTIAHSPFEVVAVPHFWRWDRLIVLYMGGDPVVLDRISEVMGRPFAQGLDEEAAEADA